jgi:hypothetical protein
LDSVLFGVCLINTRSVVPDAVDATTAALTSTATASAR